MENNFRGLFFFAAHCINYTVRNEKVSALEVPIQGEQKTETTVSTQVYRLLMLSRKTWVLFSYNQFYSRNWV